MCEKCEPFSGKWQLTNKGMRRCDCQSGVTLSEMDSTRKQGISLPPVISTEDVTIFVEMLAGLVNFFPGESGARMAIGDQIRRMCRSKAEALWLVDRLGNLYDRWPGTREMRLVYCSKYRPLDGLELDGCFDDAYPDGIPSENPKLQAPEQRFLPAPKGEAVSAADSVNETVLMLAQAKSMKFGQRHVDVPDIPILSRGERISQADIDSAVNRNRERIALEELYGKEENS